MILYLFDGYRTHAFRHQARKTFIQSHPQSADALRAKSHSRGQHQVRPVWFQQIGGADVSLKALGDQGDDIHQSLG